HNSHKGDGRHKRIVNIKIKKKLGQRVGDEETDVGVVMGNDMVITSHGFATSYYLKEDSEYYG
ncbi:unnamed protein product, partial [marine sediment metagenome]